MKMDGLFRTLAERQDQSLSQAAAQVPLLLPPTFARAVGWRRAALVALSSAVAVAGAVLVLVVRRPEPSVRFHLEDQRGGNARAGVAGMALAARADLPLPLRFSDGSTVTLAPGAQGRVQRLAAAGAEVVLERGRLQAEVAHTDRTRWVFAAGPFRIQVTGTRFAADWSPHAEELAVTLYEGAVTVDGPGLGTGGLPLEAGHVLRVGGPGRQVVREALATAPATPTAQASPAQAPALPPPPVTAPAALDEGQHWKELTRRGLHTAALLAAERVGFDGLCRRLGPRDLLLLADAARLAGVRDRAGQAFASLADRFPQDRLAPDAVFGLGRLAVDAGHPAEAIRWFERYVRSWPDGALAEPAAGRLLQSHAQVSDSATVSALARSYLEKHPNGSYAGLARRLAAAAPAR